MATNCPRIFHEGASAAPSICCPIVDTKEVWVDIWVDVWMDIIPMCKDRFGWTLLKSLGGHFNSLHPLAGGIGTHAFFLKTPQKHPYTPPET